MVDHCFSQRSLRRELGFLLVQEVDHGCFVLVVGWFTSSGGTARLLSSASVAAPVGTRIVSLFFESSAAFRSDLAQAVSNFRHGEGLLMNWDEGFDRSTASVIPVLVPRLGASRTA